jgi:hypothetical protein
VLVSTDRIPPGEEGEIKAIFYPTGYAGERVTKRFEIISNDPANPELTVGLTANVLEVE